MKPLKKYIHFLFFFWFLNESTPALANEESPSIFRFTNGLAHAKIPFRFVHQMIVLPVMLNGQQTLNFILDTGTRTPVMLHKKTLKQLGLPRGRSIRFSGAGSKGMVSGFAVHGIDLSLPGVEARGISVVVLEKNYLRVNKLEGLEIHGILGATLFRSFVVNIDYPNQMIFLIDKNTFSPSPEYTSIPMKIVDSKPVVAASLLIGHTSYPAQLMIDTGFSHELLLRSLDYGLPADERHTYLGQGFGGTIQGKMGKIQYLKLHTLEMREVMTLFPTLETYPSNQHPEQHQGTIGNGLLKQYNIVLDYAGEMLYIKHPLTLPIQSLLEMS